MAKTMRITLAQLNLLVGDIEGNLKQHLHAAQQARDEFGADIIVFPELSLVGYPAEDLLLRPGFLTTADEALATFKREMHGIHCLVGHPQRKGQQLFNSTSLIYNGNTLQQYAKQCLPNYGVFDERRYFSPGNKTSISNIKNTACGIIICEDIWKIAPSRATAQAGAKLMLIPNASPFEVDKHEQRLAVLSKRARACRSTMVYVNQVGGQDELVFDGGSMVVNAQGELSEFAGFFHKTLLTVDIPLDQASTTLINLPTIPPQEERIYQALVLGLRDYVQKNNFPHVLVGLSGGIDSALTLAIAVDALGKDKVRAILMPSRYTADISNLDAAEIATRLGVSTETISIETIYTSVLQSLAPSFKDRKADSTEENIQARCRAILLMALSNKYGSLVLTTGNRSELAVGYCTLYGDMAGGYAVLKDVPKTLVYQLARYRNTQSAVIPLRTIERPPTAELAPNQTDQDSLPPYSELDQILEDYLNDGLSAEDIIAKGHARATVVNIINLIRKNEYKRKQAAIGPHIRHKSFGKDWRYPLTNGYKK